MFSQTEVAHNGSYDLVVVELSSLLHVAAVHIDDVVAGDDVALLVYREAAVCVAVVSEADVKTLLDNELLQMLNVGRAAVGVDVEAVGVVVHNECLRAESVEHALGDLPCRAVRHVKAYLLVLEAVLAHGDEVADVAVSARHVVNGSADVGSLGNGDLELAVDVSRCNPRP